MDARNRQSTTSGVSFLVGVALILVLPALGGAATTGTPLWLPTATIQQAEQPGEADSFLLSLDSRGARLNSLPLAQAADATGTEGDAPALVPLAPPAWAGLAILGILAYARHKHRHRGAHA